MKNIKDSKLFFKTVCKNTNKYCYLTFITNEDYLPGLFALVRALKRVKSKYRLAICIPKDNLLLYEKIKKDRLFRNSIVCTRPIIDIPNECKTFDHWKETFFKLSAASFIDYEKVIVLDCDMLICKNIDHLFDCPSGSAVQDVESLKNIYAYSSRFNSGLFVLKPNMTLFYTLCQNIGTTIKERNAAGLMVGDQDVLNYTLDNWKLSEKLHLDKKYNIFWSCFPKYEKDKYILSKDAYVIHFIGWPKPWQYSKKEIRKITADLLFDGKHFRLIFLFRKYLRLCK